MVYTLIFVALWGELLVCLKQDSTLITGCVVDNISIMTNNEIQDILTEDPVPPNFPNVCYFDINIQERIALKGLEISQQL